MIPSNDHGYPPNSGSNQPHASGVLDQYLEMTQPFSSTLDSIGSQSEGSSLIADFYPEWWFTDFILYESDDSDCQADSMSVSQTSGSARTDISSDLVTIPLFASSSRSVPVSTDTDVPSDTSISRWPYPTELDEADYAVAFDSNMPNLQWNPTELALNLSASSYSESVSGEDSERSSPERSISAQNNVAGRLPVPQMRFFKCPTCQSPYSSEARLSEHLRTSHAPARFTCSTCDRGFKQEKDLKRHRPTHEPSKRPFACSCRKRFARYDGLLRHFTTMALRPRDAGRHKAVESSPK